MGQAVAKYGGFNRTVILAGQSHNLREVEKLDLTAGRIFSKEEEGALAQVAVLGATAKEKLLAKMRQWARPFIFKASLSGWWAWPPNGARRFCGHG